MSWSPQAAFLRFPAADRSQDQASCTVPQAGEQSVGDGWTQEGPGVPVSPLCSSHSRSTGSDSWGGGNGGETPKHPRSRGCGGGEGRAEAGSEKSISFLGDFHSLVWTRSPPLPLGPRPPPSALGLPGVVRSMGVDFCSLRDGSVFSEDLQPEGAPSAGALRAPCSSCKVIP